VFLGPDPHELEVVGGVDLLDDGAGLGREAVDLGGVVHRGGVVQGGLEGDSIIVDNDDSNYAFVSLKPLDQFINLLGRHD